MRVCRSVLLFAAFALVASGCTHDFGAFDTTGATAPDGGVGASGGASGVSGTSGAGAPAGGGAGMSTLLDGSSGGALGGAGSGCDSGQKLCGNACTPADSTATGCGGPSCEPCSLAHAIDTQCKDGTCAPSGCATGYDDCDSVAENGCERPVRADPLNCGACARACSSVNVASLSCPGDSGGARCAPFCQPGHADCTSPATGDDDGCETDISSDPENCGGCGRRCALGFVCEGSVCKCDADGDCRNPGDNSSVCSSGVCWCGTGACRFGETCRQQGGTSCRCNGDRACFGAQTCCGSGCADLTSSASNCGACGHACPTGFACNSGVCGCGGDDDCNAGSSGTCSVGLCTCGGTECAEGQRCLSNGQCG